LTQYQWNLTRLDRNIVIAESGTARYRDIPVMQLEFHQLERQGEHLRVQQPQQQKRLLASLAGSGQQTPIVVVPLEGEPDRYVVIDGHKRIAALQQLGRDTVEAVVWPMTEAEALVLNRSSHWSQRESALEEGWLLADFQKRFGYSLQELAKRFDRSVSWVCCRLALVEVLPLSVQQQVRSGEISAQAATKYLLPVARSSLEECRQMATAFIRCQCTTRQAGQLYAACRKASPQVRKRIFEQPQLFLKTQNQAPPPPADSPIQQVLGDLETIAAIARRANRRLKAATAELERMDQAQSEQMQQQLQRTLGELSRLANAIPRQETSGKEPHDQPTATSRDSGNACPGSQEKGDRSSAGNLSPERAQGHSCQLNRRTPVSTAGESRTLPAADPGAALPVQGEFGTGP
jgi:ParB/RepB/Spo0J family partition protein